MKDWIRAFLIGGLIMLGEKFFAGIIGPEYAALGLPTEFIAAFFMATRKDKIEYFYGIILILLGFIVTLSWLVISVYNKVPGNTIVTAAIFLWFVLSYLILKFYTIYK